MELDPKRLKEIVGHLYARNAEIVIYRANTKHKSYYEPNWKDSWECTVRLDSNNEFSITAHELDFLSDDQIIELAGGCDDPESPIETFVYVMTNESKKRLKSILRSILEKSKKITT